MQDIYVSKKVINNSPKKHVDIGSRIDGFVANVATSMSLEVFDVRPINIEIENVKFKRIDIINDIDKISKGYCDSVSCLHTLEHIGLGRYGDKIDINGHIKGLNAISKIVKRGVKVYISTPIGPRRVEFNAHRVFSLNYLFRILKERFTIEKFSYIDDDSKIHRDIDIKPDNKDNNLGCKYGCGIFEMTK